MMTTIEPGYRADQSNLSNMYLFFKKEALKGVMFHVPDVAERDPWWGKSELLWTGDYRQSEVRFIKVEPIYKIITFWPFFYFASLARYHPRAEFHEISPGSTNLPYKTYLNYGNSAFGLVVFGNYSKSGITRRTDIKLPPPVQGTFKVSCPKGTFVSPLIP